MFAINLLYYLRNSIFISNLFVRLNINFFILMLLIVGQQTLNIWIQGRNQQAISLVNHALLVEYEERSLLQCVINEKRLSLKNYINKQIEFNNNFNRLYNLVRNNPTQIKQLSKIKYLHNRRLEINQIKFSNISKYKFVKNILSNSLDTEITTLLNDEEILLAKYKLELKKLFQISTIINMVFTIIILIMIGLNLWLLHRRIKVPLDMLMEVGNRWRIGQMDARLSYSSNDEIGYLAKTLNATAEEIHLRQQSIETQNQHLQDLISTLSHDLRTPLIATRTTLEGMLRGAFGSVNDSWKEVFEEYYQTNNDLLNLVENLLDVSRYEAGYSEKLNYDPLNWEKIITKVINQIKAAAKLEFVINYKISQCLPTIYGDELEIQRVIQNLLDNAIRVSELHKEIFIEVGTLGKDRVQVSVHDHGSGIALQEQEKIFHRFSQGRGKRGKSGLGLYLCRQIIEAHRGTISVKSKPGEGSVFWFTLPTSINIPQTEFKHNRNRCEEEDAVNDI